MVFFVRRDSLFCPIERKFAGEEHTEKMVRAGSEQDIFISSEWSTASAHALTCRLFCPLPLSLSIKHRLPMLKPLIIAQLDTHPA